MKFLRAFSLFLLTSLTLASCYDDPDFGAEPRLTDIDVYLKSLSSISDSLIISVTFEDGDGDLGIVSGDNYALYDYPPNPDTGEEFWVYDEENPDPELPEFSCALYELRNISTSIDSTQIEYVRADYNEDYYNYSISVYVLRDDEFQEEDLLTQCDAAPLGMRFPLLKDEPYNGPLTGTIDYRVESPEFRSRYRNDTLKLGVAIRDRAGHVSNEILTEPFALNDITQVVEEE